MGAPLGRLIVVVIVVGGWLVLLGRRCAADVDPAVAEAAGVDEDRLAIAALIVRVGGTLEELTVRGDVAPTAAPADVADIAGQNIQRAQADRRRMIGTAMLRISISWPPWR